MQANNEHILKKYEPFWGSWQIDKFVGQGSFGRVYRIFKKEWGYKYESALKVISIPTDIQLREATSTLGSDNNRLKKHFEDAVKSIIEEIVLLYKLKGNTNIVSYEDHKVEERSGEIGWDILIRMEFLSPLNTHISNKGLTLEDVLKLGIDICSALEVCSINGIVHRDIKDDNIFVTQNCTFKLGDFGIARELSDSLSATIRGTPLYMAPEVFKGEPYDSRADLYSLGILLYKLLNKSRFPFMPLDTTDIKLSDKQNSLEKRLLGHPMPLPCECSGDIGEIILKMCEYKQLSRFETPIAAKDALLDIYNQLDEWEKSRIVLPGNNPLDKKIQMNTHFESSNTVFLTHETDTRSKKGIERFIKQDVSPYTNKSFQGLANNGNQIGNSPSNIINGGLVTFQGSWTYISNTGDSNCIYKIKNDLTEIVKNNVEAWFINIVNGWIYYSNASDGEKIYKLSLDGSVNQILCQDKAWYLNVYYEWIYYCNESDHFSLYKIKTDGTQRTKLNHDQCFNLSIYDDFLYYCNKGSSMLYRVALDGKGRETVGDDPLGYFGIENEWIYYSNKNDNLKLYKIHKSGTGKQKLNDDISCNINVYKGHIYYCNKSDGSSIYCTSIDGRYISKLNEDNSDNINIVDDWLYYCNKSNDKIYKIRLDPPCIEDDWVYL